MLNNIGIPGILSLLVVIAIIIIVIKIIVSKRRN